MTRLELRNVGLDVAGKPLVRGLSFDVPAHELHVLLGPSGSGKTTVLKAIAGLHPLAEGEILLDGARIDHLPPQRRGIVLLHQEDTLFPHLRVDGNIAFGPRLRGIASSETKARTERLLALVGLPGFGSRRVAHLSGGERQRVALARALAVEPNILLLDEPFSALDRSLRQSLRDEVRDILRATGITSLFVTHDRDEALAIGDELILLREGRLADRGPPGRVFARPATVNAARVLGRRNLYAFRRQGNMLETTIGPIPAPTGATAAAGWVLVNEEDIDVRQDPNGSAVIERIEFLGSRSIAKLRRGDGTLLAELRGVSDVTAGSRVEPVWQPERSQVYPDEVKTPQS